MSHKPLYIHSIHSINTGALKSLIHNRSPSINSYYIHPIMAQPHQTSQSSSAYGNNNSRTQYKINEPKHYANKRIITDSTEAPYRKQFKSGSTMDHSENTILTIRQVKHIQSTPYSNELTFAAKVLKIENRRKIWDSRVQFHRQKVLFADECTYLVAFMMSDRHEDIKNPRLVEGCTNLITNFRVMHKGEILLHEHTKFGL